MGKTIKTLYFDDYAIVNNTQIININEVYQYYVIENHSRKDTAKNFKTNEATIYRLMQHWNLVKPQKLSNELNKQTLLERYGDAHYNNLEKQHRTMIERYGYENFFTQTELVKESHIKAFGYKTPAENPEINKQIRKSRAERSSEDLALEASRRKQTCLSRYGVEHVMQHPEFAKKNSAVPGKYERTFNTRKKNNTVNTSKPENDLNEFLIQLFGADDILRNYRDKGRYPFHCDFYIRSLDLFIELNLFWTHGSHPFDPTNKEDVARLEYLNEKAKTSTFYKAGVDVWTVRDPLKLQIAKNNNLDYIMIYNECEIPNLKELIKEKQNASKRL